MKKSLIIMLAGALAISMTTGCKDQTPKSTQQPAAQAPASAMPQAAPAKAPGKTGKVAETMNSGGYTYVQVDTGSESVWAAAPEFAVKVGDPVIVPEGMPMVNYHSKTLDRTFDTVYFVPSIMVGGEMGSAPANAQMPAGHPPINGSTPAPADVDFSGLAKPEGGKTVAEIFSSKGELSGKEVSIRGKVVKFSPEIMGKNWIHLQDGSGAEGTNDLTVTTSVMAKVGDTVLINGVLATDKDFGYGYKYDVIVEDAKVTVE